MKPRIRCQVSRRYRHCRTVVRYGEVSLVPVRMIDGGPIPAEHGDGRIKPGNQYGRFHLHGEAHAIYAACMNACCTPGVDTAGAAS